MKRFNSSQLPTPRARTEANLGLCLSLYFRPEDNCRRPHSVSEEAFRCYDLDSVLSECVCTNRIAVVHGSLEA